jgi:hypothetical protein
MLVTSPPERCDLANGAPADKGVFLARHQANCFYLRCQSLIGQCRAKLKFEIRKDAQPAHNGPGPDTPGKINQQAGKGNDGICSWVFQRFSIISTLSSTENSTDFVGCR